MPTKQISGVAAKSLPVDDDLLLIADSDAGNAWKKVPFGSVHTSAWKLTAFPGASHDARLEYALANVAPGTRIVLPPCEADDWLDFEAPQVLDVTYTEDRWLELVGFNSKIRWQGGDETWLHIMGTTPAIANGRTLVRGLIIVPATANHWRGQAIVIENAGFTQIDRCRIWRFAAGLTLLNSAAPSWTENIHITESELYGNRIGVLGTTTSAQRSQRGCQITGTIIATGGMWYGMDWATDQASPEVDVIHYGIKLEDVSWYNGKIHIIGGLKRTNSTLIWLDGGSCLNVDFFVDAEGDPSLLAPNQIGLRLTNSDAGRVAELSACTGVMKILGLPDEIGSVPISDERTGVTHRYGLGEIKFEGKGFYDPLASPPSFTNNYNVVPTTDVLSTVLRSTFRLPNAMMMTDGTVLREEWFTYYEEAYAELRSEHGYAGWTQRYLLPDLTLVTKHSGADKPLPLKCMPLNIGTQVVASFDTEDWVNYTDITDLNVGLIYLEDAAHLYQIRGGTFGQIIRVMCKTNSTGIKNTKPMGDAVAVDNVAGIAHDATTAHFDGLTRRAQPGFWFRVADDDTDYTITACTALTGTDADITFTPGVVPEVGWANNAAVAIYMNYSMSMANNQDFVPGEGYRIKTFQYQYYGGVGNWWQEIGASESDDTVYRVQSYLSAGQLKALRATPLTIIPASGAGYANVLVGIQFWLSYSTAAFVVAGDNDIEARYTDGSGELLATLECTDFLDQTSDQTRWLYPTPAAAIAPVENAAIVLKMAGAAEITAGSGTLHFRAFYRRIEMNWEVPGLGYW